MSPIDNILLATDFSKGAEPATALAFEMARRFSAKLTLLHVYSIPTYKSSFSGIYEPPLAVVEQIRIDAQHELEDLRQRAVREGVRAESLALEGIPADLIVAVAVSHHAGLIVMGTAGRTGVSRFLLGSVAERVIHTAECPVLTVRAPDQARELPIGHADAGGSHDSSSAIAK
jgi:nucleotide-binding universal stress UspA family protein